MLESDRGAKLSGSFGAPSFQPVEKPPKQQSVGSYEQDAAKLQNLTLEVVFA
jgi:hypothetical protein